VLQLKDTGYNTKDDEQAASIKGHNKGLAQTGTDYKRLDT